MIIRFNTGSNVLMGGIYDLSVEIDPQVLANTGGVDAGSDRPQCELCRGHGGEHRRGDRINDHDCLWRWQWMDDCGGRFAGRADAFDYGIQRRNCATSLGLGGLAVLNAGQR